MDNGFQIKRKERGQSMVELGLVITILMVLLAGTIDLGRAFFTWLAMRDAAQEGASYGSIAPPSGSYSCNAATSKPYPPVCARVWDKLYIKDPVTEPNTYTTIDVAVTGSCQGNTIQVDVDYPQFPLTMPFLGILLGKDYIEIHATVNDTILMPCP